MIDNQLDLLRRRLMLIVTADKRGYDQHYCRGVAMEILRSLAQIGCEIETGDGAMSKFKVGDRVVMVNRDGYYVDTVRNGTKGVIVRDDGDSTPAVRWDCAGCVGKDEYVEDSRIALDDATATTPYRLTIERAGTEDVVYRVTDAGGHEVLNVRANEWDAVKATVERVR